jgi:hypothetical protein
MEQLAHLTKLTSLDLSKNGLGGSLSADIQKLSTLESLILANNLITGSIPTELTLLTRLNAVLLQQNRIAGRVPPLNFEKFSTACALQSYSHPENTFSCPLPSGAVTCHNGADAGVPTCGGAPTTTSPPAPTPGSYHSYATTAAPTTTVAPRTTTAAPNTTAPPTWAHQCIPGKCNVCAACCHDYVGTGLPCEKCFQEACEGTPPAPAPTPEDVNLITALGVSFSAAAGLGLVTTFACVCARRCRKQEEPLVKQVHMSLGRDDFATVPLIDPGDHDEHHEHAADGGARYR